MISLSLYERQGAKLEGERVTSLLFDNVSGALLFETQKGRFAACCLKTGKEGAEGKIRALTGRRKAAADFSAANGMAKKLCLGMPVWSTAGCFCGTLTDAEITAKGKIRCVVTEKGRFCHVTAVGDGVLIRGVNAARAFAKTLPKRQKPRAEKRRYGNFNFLVGQRVDKTICNFQGEVMIKRDAYITAETLRQAKLWGKLTELCLHCYSST